MYHYIIQLIHYNRLMMMMMMNHRFSGIPLTYMYDNYLVFLYVQLIILYIWISS